MRAWWVLLGLSGCCLYSAPSYRGPLSDHFDGQRFHNPGAPQTERSLGDVIGLVTAEGAVPWPEEVALRPQPPPPARVERGALRVTFVNHATVLVQLDGLNILTDPIYSERASPLSMVGPRRVHAPGVVLADLPRIHLVLVSHSHYDHLDLPTLQALWARDQPRVVVGLGTAPILRAAGVPKVRELDWWRGFRDPSGVRITSVPVQHFANRGLCDAGGQLWTGYVIEGAGGPVYFAGDTGAGPHFAAARARFGDFRLAILPIGAYQPEWFMAPIHIDPAGAVAAHLELGAQRSLGMHFGTFDLAFEGQDDPPRALAAARAARGVEPDAFFVLAPGEGRDIPTAPIPSAAAQAVLGPPSARAAKPVPASCGPDLSEL